MKDLYRKVTKMEQKQGENAEVLQERYELVLERIKEIGAEGMGHPALDAYFRKTAAFLQKLSDYYAFVDQGHMRDAQLEQLQTWNHEIGRAHV